MTKTTTTEITPGNENAVEEAASTVDDEVKLSAVPEDSSDNVEADTATAVESAPGEVQRSSSILENSTRSNTESVKAPTYPKAFYCPLTREVFMDPVVTNDGLSYERSALEDRGDNIGTVYSNRALKAIIDETVEYKMSSGLKQFQHSVRQFSQQLMNEYHRPLPDGYYCPITLNLIHVPVIDPEGYSYEQAAIENWIRHNGASPVTRQSMTLDDFLPNRTLGALMDEEKAKSEEVMHPTFKQWKEEPAPIPGDMDLEAGGSVHGSNVTTFPTTPEQLEEMNRLRRIRRFRRCLFWCVLIILLGIMAWIVPVLSTVILVVLLLGLAIVAGYSSSSGGFRSTGPS